MKDVTVVWTCDRCEFSVEKTWDHRPPAGWVGLCYNDAAPDSPFEHTGWRRLHFCPDCAAWFKAEISRPR